MHLSLHAQTVGFLERYRIRPKKSLSQRFLIDEQTFQDLLSSVNVQKSDVILEVGAGLGFLTEALANLGGTIVAVEVDKDLCGALRDRFKDQPKVSILCENVLHLDLHQLGHETKFKSIGNLPYHISGLLLRWFLNHRNFFSEMTLMVQKEVAQRIVSQAGTKSYGVLSLVCQYFTTPRILFLVPPSSFIPPPKVESAVVKLTPLRDSAETNPVFEKLVKRSFSQRRKTLFNNLRSWDLLTPPQWKSLLLEAKIKEKERPEEVPLETYIQLAEKIRKQQSPS